MNAQRQRIVRVCRNNRVYWYEKGGRCHFGCFTDLGWCPLPSAPYKDALDDGHLYEVAAGQIAVPGHHQGAPSVRYVRARLLVPVGEKP